MPFTVVCNSDGITARVLVMRGDGAEYTAYYIDIGIKLTVQESSGWTNVAGSRLDYVQKQRDEDKT
jgi:hypothetical protein